MFLCKICRKPTLSSALQTAVKRAETAARDSFLQTEDSREKAGNHLQEASWRTEGIIEESV
jgi:hypothetical protein